MRPFASNPFEPTARAITNQVAGNGLNLSPAALEQLHEQEIAFLAGRLHNALIGSLQAIAETLGGAGAPSHFTVIKDRRLVDSVASAFDERLRLIDRSKQALVAASVAADLLQACRHSELSSHNFLLRLHEDGTCKLWPRDLQRRPSGSRNAALLRQVATATAGAALPSAQAIDVAQSESTAR